MIPGMRIARANRVNETAALDLLNELVCDLDLRFCKRSVFYWRSCRFEWMTRSMEPSSVFDEPIDAPVYARALFLPEKRKSDALGRGTVKLRDHECVMALLRDKA